jgi:nitroreductase
MEFSAALRSRRSIRAFSGRPVKRETINDILFDAIESPSSSNTQLYKVAIADVTHANSLDRSC